MLSRLFGIAALTLAAATTLAVPAHADDDLTVVTVPAYDEEDAADEAAAYAEDDTDLDAKQAGETGARVHLDGESMPDIVLPRELHMPICAPGPGLGIPLVDQILPGLVGCPAAALGR
ncbi:hypothetical protein [Nonomuraea rubra]|uniref:hypothetical protein n=1 Tax=Nonomuraea rubra TaxID=46180 RepID=UPI0033C6253C